MSPEELQALSLPILGTYEEDETFALKPEEQAKEFPLIALRNMSILPGTVVPILVGRRKSMQVIRQSEIRERCFGVVTQRDANVEDPQLSDLFTVGTIVEVSQIVELPTGELSAILRGRQRFSLQHLTMDDPYLMGRVHLLEDSLPAADKEEEYKVTVELIHERLLGLLDRLAPNAPNGFRDTIRGLKNRAYIVHLAGSLLQLSMEDRQKLLEMDSIYDRAVYVLGRLHDQISESSLREEILNRTRREMDQQQREYFLQQQMRTIQEELGTGPSADDEIEELRKKGKEKLWSEVRRLHNLFHGL